MTKGYSENIRIIKSDSRAHDGFWVACRHLWAEVVKFRSQIWTVYKQGFRNSYHGAGLGVVWNFILPIVPVTVYLFLSSIRAIPNFDGVDSATFLTFGVTIWFVFAGFVRLPISVVQSRNQEAMKTSLPLSASIASSFTALSFETFVRFLFVLGVIVFTQSWPTIFSPLLFFFFAAAFFLFFGIGLVLSILNVIYKDVSRIVNIVLQYGLFVSGVIFPLGESDWAIFLSKVNPFAVFVDACRQIVFSGELDSWLPFAIWSAIGVLCFLIGCRLFYVMEYRIRGLA